MEREVENMTNTKRTHLIAGFLLVAVIGLAACAPREAPSVQEPEAELVVEVNWTPDTECAACHATESESFANAACLAAKHADLECSGCHEDQTALTGVHQGVTTAVAKPKALQVSSVQEGTCLTSGCHAADSLDGLVALTQGSAVLIDERGNAVNPHEMPSSTPKHLAESMTCTDCHTVHGEEGYEAAKIYCYNCHHHKVFECGTCHKV
jgi:hypothetical protein